jgi:hypothetical protein
MRLLFEAMSVKGKAAEEVTYGEFIAATMWTRMQLDETHLRTAFEVSAMPSMYICTCICLCILHIYRCYITALTYDSSSAGAVAAVRPAA